MVEILIEFFYLIIFLSQVPKTRLDSHSKREWIYMHMNMTGWLIEIVYFLVNYFDLAYQKEHPGLHLFPGQFH